MLLKICKVMLAKNKGGSARRQFQDNTDSKNIFLPPLWTKKKKKKRNELLLFQIEPLSVFPYINLKVPPSPTPQSFFSLLCLQFFCVWNFLRLWIISFILCATFENFISVLLNYNSRSKFELCTWWWCWVVVYCSKYCFLFLLD